MKDQIIIENIQEKDLDEIIDLGLNTPELHIQDKEPIYYTKEVLSGLIKSPNDIYLVAKVDGKIVGYRLATINPYLKEAYLTDIVVKPEFRRKGVASKLYKKTFEILREKEVVWAWALIKDSNEKMMKIMEKKGFLKGSKFNFYYKVAPF